MRLFLVAAIAAVVGCSPAPRPTPEVMPEVAAAYGELYAAWDGPRMLALFAPKMQAKGVSPKHFAWLRTQLGACGDPRFMWSMGKRSAHFEYPCERGTLAAFFTLDASGKLVHARSGAVGVPVPEVLRDAAVAVLASLPWGYEADHRFENNLNLYDARKYGRCELLRPWTVGQHSAMFHVQCEHAAALLHVGVRAGGTLKEVYLQPAEKVYQGPPVTREGPPA